jgi:hypothetical protein
MHASVGIVSVDRCPQNGQVISHVVMIAGPEVSFVIGKPEPFIGS